jgi:antirestriction protein
MTATRDREPTTPDHESTAPDGESTEAGHSTTAPDGESTEADKPRIYVACLAAYNRGVLHGRWLDAARDAEDLHADIREMLAASPIPGAEEFAIHDAEGFGDHRIDPHENIEDVAALAALIVDYGTVVAAYASHTGVEIAELAARFEDAYRGSYQSTADYAHDLLDEQLSALPENLRCYFDYVAYARDLDINGDIVVIEQGSTLHVFDGHA